MAININRQQTRLAKSKEAGVAVINEIDFVQKKLKNLIGDLDQLQVASKTQENTVEELMYRLRDLKARPEPTEDEVAPVTLLTTQITEQLAQAQAEVQSISEKYTAKRAERNELEIKLAALLNGPTMLQINAQEKALAKQEAAYPQLLKRHLRKCRKHGWADGRLTGGKKK